MLFFSTQSDIKLRDRFLCCHDLPLFFFYCLKVQVEEYGAGSTIDLETLDGTWRLNYTTAGDVVVLFEAATRLPFLQVL